MDYVPALARWLHFLAGVMWIGLLYYFNFVQVPALKAATADNSGGRYHQARCAAARCSTFAGPPWSHGLRAPRCWATSSLPPSRCRRGWRA